jgi:hypothetical protein
MCLHFQTKIDRLSSACQIGKKIMNMVIRLLIFVVANRPHVLRPLHPTLVVAAGSCDNVPGSVIWDLFFCERQYVVLFILCIFLGFVVVIGSN